MTMTALQAAVEKKKKEQLYSKEKWGFPLQLGLQPSVVCSLPGLV